MNEKKNHRTLKYLVLIIYENDLVISIHVSFCTLSILSFNSKNLNKILCKE